MFRGGHAINLDAKGRITIPTAYRAELQDCCERQMIITYALDEKGKNEAGCLWLYPLPEWERLEQTISKLPTVSKTASRLRRMLIGNAHECEMDKQGRLLIAETLRTHAGFNKNIFLLGQLNKFEVWSLEAWQAKQQEWQQDDDDEDLDVLENLSF